MAKWCCKSVANKMLDKAKKKTDLFKEVFILPFIFFLFISYQYIFKRMVYNPI